MGKHVWDIDVPKEFPSLLHVRDPSVLLSAAEMLTHGLGLVVVSTMLPDDAIIFQDLHLPALPHHLHTRVGSESLLRRLVCCRLFECLGFYHGCHEHDPACCNMGLDHCRDIYD